MVEAIDRDSELDFYVMTLPQVADSNSQLDMTEDELTMAIGQTVRNLFTLLNYTQPKVPQLVGVVVIKEKAEAEVETEVEEVEKVALPVIEEEIPFKIDLPPPVEVEETVEIILPPKEDREQVIKLIDGYREQIRILSQVVADEKKLLKTQEQIQTLQVVSRNTTPQFAQARKERMQKIEFFEKEIKDSQEKIAALQQTLQDI